MGIVPAAEQTLRILSLLTRSKGALPAAQIAVQLELPRSTVYHLLSVMIEQGFVSHYPEARRYGLGPSSYELGGGFTRQQPLARLGRPLVETLVDRLGESAHLAVLSGNDVLYLVEERAPRRPSLVSDEGVRLPAHLTATGRAMLAYLPKPQLRALYPDPSAFPIRDGSDWNYRKLRAVLEKVSKHGFATEDGEVTPHLSSIGVPVLDRAKWPIAAVAITFSDSVAESEYKVWVSALQATAQELTRRLG